MMRNTRLDSRSMSPRRPKISPDAKSTMRLASAVVMPPRLMITGMSCRKYSPIVWASAKFCGVIEAM